MRIQFYVKLCQVAFCRMALRMHYVMHYALSLISWLTSTGHSELVQSALPWR